MSEQILKMCHRVKYSDWWLGRHSAADEIIHRKGRVVATNITVPPHHSRVLWDDDDLPVFVHNRKLERDE